MITLAIPHAVLATLGSNITVAYDKIVVSPSVDSEKRRITGRVRLMSSANPTNQPIDGKLVIDTITGLLQIEIERLGFYRAVQLSAAQKAAAIQIATDAQDAIESGLIALGTVDGTQATGT